MQVWYHAQQLLPRQSTGDANAFYSRMYLQQEAGKTDTSKQNKTSAAQQMHYWHKASNITCSFSRSQALKPRDKHIVVKTNSQLISFSFKVYK